MTDRREIGAFAIVAFSGIVLLVLAVLGGCPAHAPPPPPAPVTTNGLPSCPATDPAPTSEDVCQGISTADHFPIAVCRATVGCIYPKALVYCSATCDIPRLQR